MVGSKVILTVKGDLSDEYFTANPQITFFKGVFRRHTRFSIETITQSFNNQSIHATRDSQFSLLGNDGIKRTGDLLKSMYLSFTIPDIYSGGYSSESELYHFRWIRNLGFYIIKNIKLKIGGSLIQEFTGEWLDVHKELYLSDEEKDAVNEMIGNTPDMVNPEISDGNLVDRSIQAGSGTVLSYLVTSKKYPHSKKTDAGDTSNFYEDNFSNAVTTKVYNTTTSAFNEASNFIDDRTLPSIYGRKIKVPLSFWFTKSTSQALPMISLQNTPIEIDLTMRPINDLYTVTNVNNSGIDGGSNTYRIKNNNGTDIKNVRIQYFLKDDNTDYEVSYSTNEKILVNNLIKINPELNLTYIFLDNEERNKFARSTHQYLVETIKKVESTNNRNTTVRIDANSNNHVKEIIVIPKRTDAVNVNEWDNFTNWLQKDINPTSFSYWQGDSFNMNFYDTIENRYPFPSRKYTTRTFMKPAYLKKDLIKSMSILLNNTPLFNKKNGVYYQNQQVLEYYRTSSKDGIYTYSFSLNPRNPTQPSGSLNFSSQDVKLEIDFNSLPQQTSYVSGNEANYVSDYGIDVSIYLVQYNILHIEYGTGGLKFQA